MGSAVVLCSSTTAAGSVWPSVVAGSVNVARSPAHSGGGVSVASLGPPGTPGVRTASERPWHGGAGPVRGATICSAEPLAGWLASESRAMTTAVAFGRHHEPRQVNPQPAIPIASGMSVRWLRAGLTVVTVASTGIASPFPALSSSSVSQVEICSEQCAPTNSTTPITPDGIARVWAVAVTSEGTHGACSIAGPGPAAKSSAGAATRNALSGMPGAGAELDTGTDTTPERLAAVLGLTSCAPAAQAAR